MFMQADHALDRARGGLGIGLTLARRLIELHGGTLEARSRGIGHGSTFMSRLPLADRPAAPPPDPAIHGERRKRRDAACWWPRTFRMPRR